MSPRHIAAIQKTKADPESFSRSILQQTLFDRQAEIVRAVRDHRSVAVKACHASGKTFAAAILVLWWLFRYPEAIAVTTAPTWTQVEKLIWGEIKQALRQSRCRFPEPLTTELNLGPKRYALGISTTESVRFQGIHAANVLIVVDEAPGIRADIWEGIDGIEAGGNVRIVLLGNPTVPSGPFYHAFTRDRASWCTQTISAFDTPNLKGLTVESLLAMTPDELDQAADPHFITRRWAAKYIRRWGVNHPKVQARVLGAFPREDAGTLIPLDWIERAQQTSYDLKTTPRGRKQAGIDIAGPGEDETVVAITQERELIELHCFPGADPRGEVLAALRPHKSELSLVNVDSIGLGYYFARHIQDAGFPVQDINVGEAAVNDEAFANLKAELYWNLREDFERGMLGIVDDELQGQLSSIRRFETPRGKTAIESKEDMRKRGLPSPDRAEALMLARAPILPSDKPEVVVYDGYHQISRY